MKSLALLVCFLSLGLLAGAQDTKTINDPNAQVRNVKGFHSIRISSGIDLYLSQGTEAVAVSASKPEYRDKIQTVVEDGVLKIYMQHDGYPMNWGGRSPKLKAYVSANTLDNLKASGGSDVYLQGTFRSNKLEIHISGGSDLKGDMEIRELSLDQSGGSDADISGKVEKLAVEANGGSDLKAYDLKADYCDIFANGGSDVQITVNKELKAEATGGSDIFYQGTGVITHMRSGGSGSIKKKG